MSRRLTVFHLGRVEYADGLVLQDAFARARRAGAIGDSLLLLEHPPVITLGRGGSPANVLLSREALARLGVEVHETNRGGDVTYHGPGQLVGYPVLDLAPDRQDVRKYVRSLEEALIRTLHRFGLAAGRIPGWPGVWMGSEGSGDARKIGAIGVHLSRWITTHGFALNVCTSLEHFARIIPCGIRDAGVTSMERELGTAPPLREVAEALARGCAEVFASALEPAPPPVPTISVAVLRARQDTTEVLLVKRTASRGGFWQLVTGRVERGESAAAAASRELAEESGWPGPVRSLGYTHAFAVDDGGPMPAILEETAFAAAWPGEQMPVRLGPEHVESAWVPAEEALRALPFAGLRRAVELAVKPRV